ncbi:MAG: dephospho-CoA kinase [Candidatus Latescibacteria bacterium]|nr:dephospho-CoA kinase [Candidatus Latescibacterota bacterium]
MLTGGAAVVVVGVTGGIATGKSVVCRVFEELGGVVISADRVGHEVLGRADVRDRLIEAFGRDMLSPDGTVDRRTLGKFVFGDPAARERLNQIVHPSLLAEVRRQIAALRASGFGGVVVLDAALLIEWGPAGLVDYVVVVTAPEDQQMARLVEQKGFSAEEAAQRVAAQVSPQERLRWADAVINASGSVSETERQARGVWEAINSGCHSRESGNL